MSGKADVVDDDILNTKFDSIIAGNYPSIILDFGKIEVLHSHALGLIVSFAQTMQAKGCRFAICCVPHRIQYLFDITRTAKLVHIYDTLENALRGIQNQ